MTKWVRCDNYRCKHWTHLKYCTTLRAMRSNTTFYCIHCEDMEKRFVTLFCFSLMGVMFMVMMLSATFNNISVTSISWRLDLLVEGTGVTGENHWPAASNCQTWSHNVVSSTHRLSGIWTRNICGDRHWIHRYYHTITTTTALSLVGISSLELKCIQLNFDFF